MIVLVLALLVFGPAKLPEIGRQIGGLMREFNKMRDEVRSTFDVDSYRYDSASSNGSSQYDATGTARRQPLDQYTEEYHPYNSDEADALSSDAPPRYVEGATLSALDGDANEHQALDHGQAANGGGPRPTEYGPPRPWSIADSDDVEDASEYSGAARSGGARSYDRPTISTAAAAANDEGAPLEIDGTRSSRGEQTPTPR